MNMTVRTSDLLSPVNEVAITSIANGFSQGTIVRSTAKRPATSVAARYPLTLTVASGEVTPVTVMVLESTTMSLEGKVTSSVKGARVMVVSNAGSAVGDGKGEGKGRTVGEGACVGVGGGAGVGVSVWVGMGVGAAVAVGLGVPLGVEGAAVTIVGEASAVAVGAEVAESSPQAISRTRIRPSRVRPRKRPNGAAPRNGSIILTGFLATGFLIADWYGLSVPEYRDMHFPPNTSSYGSYYNRTRLDAIADESASYVKIGGSTLE